MQCEQEAAHCCPHPAIGNFGGPGSVRSPVGVAARRVCDDGQKGVGVELEEELYASKVVHAAARGLGEGRAVGDRAGKEAVRSECVAKRTRVLEENSACEERPNVLGRRRQTHEVSDDLVCFAAVRRA
eukprot:718848-Pleurochrysis_carterae.AAC.1